MKIVVTGGSGFIGSRICSASVSAKIETVSISRRGETPFPIQGKGNVFWRKGSVFESESWRTELSGAYALIHSVGVIVENPEEHITFQKFNTESAIHAGKAAEEAGVPVFVLVSASGAPPTIPETFIETKRDAEEKLAEMDFRLVILRPGLVYGPGRWWSYLLKMILTPLYVLPSNIDAPIHADTLGKAAVQAASDESVSGIIEIPEIKKLAFSYRQEVTIREES